MRLDLWHLALGKNNYNMNSTYDLFVSEAPEALMQALEDLDYLAALDDDGNLSEVGIIMSELPLEPPLARALIAACEFDCVSEILTIAAMLTGEEQVYLNTCMHFLYIPKYYIQNK